MSDAPPEPAPSARPATPKALWPDFAAARAWPEAAPAAVALGHRRDGTLVHVRVEPSGLAAYQDLSVEAPMPDGARVVAWHESAAGALLGGYVLEKRSGVWRAFEVGGDGALVPGNFAPCVRCHDMATADHLFGIRALTRPAAPSKGAELMPPAPR
jgi:hypothetical protein